MANKPLYVEMPIDVKTYDIDFGGIVSNIVYIRWLEDLRLRMLDTYFPLKSQTEAGYAPVLVRTDIRYHRPVKLHDKPMGAIWVRTVGRFKAHLEGYISLDGNVVASFGQTIVFAEFTTGKPIPLPGRLRSLYERGAQW
jgi:acyl-CoA thioester hydrolase